MIQVIKNYAKTNPRLYDFLNSLRPIRAELEKWLDAFSRANGREVNFVQIGASDGLRWDPFRRFIVRDYWRGLLVEPVPLAFELLKRNYAYLHSRTLRFVNAAVTQEDGFIQIWSYSDRFCNSLSTEEMMYYLRKSSLDKGKVESSLGDYGKTDDNISCYSVRCMPMDQLLREYWSDEKVDLVVIDAEGHDDKIIRSINFERNRPQAIVFESHSLRNVSELTCFLGEQGYRVLDLGGDSVAQLRGDSGA